MRVGCSSRYGDLDQVRADPLAITSRYTYVKDVEDSQRSIHKLTRALARVNIRAGQS